MQDRRTIRCGDAPGDATAGSPGRDLRLRLWGRDGPDKLTLRIEDIDRKLCKNVPPEFQDLLEIATYVYSADQAVRRGGDDVDTFGDRWRRDLHFIIPVRNPDFWNAQSVLNSLRNTLGFLSDDSYHFNFIPLTAEQPLQGYLDFSDGGRLFGHPEQVMMFSGGLDSLAGTVEEVLVEKRKVVLVTHKSTPKLNKSLGTLKEMIAEKAGENAPLHVGVRIHKNKSLNREYTQRTRSFLYVAIGATIARMLDLRNVRFYENGILSLNLPVCAQVVGGRATRTTHPRVLRGFQEILSLVVGEPFAVENPFIWKTKADIVEAIVKAGCQEMIAPATSCTHTWGITKRHSHCGACSQCIDRRFAVVAAAAAEFDPVEAFKIDIFTQGRNKDEDKIMVAAYLERANQVRGQDDIAQFIARYSEVTRVFRYLDGTPASVAQRVFDLYKRHAKEVCGALDTLVQRNISAIRERTLPGDCLLRTVYESGSVISAPAVAVRAEQPDHYFRKRGGVWEARFKGNKPILLTGVDKGAGYISVLLGRPNEEVSVYEIVCSDAIDACNSVLSAPHSDRENGLQVTQGIPLGDAGFVADRKAVEQYRERAQEILREIEDVRDAGETVKERRLEEEIARIARAIEEATGLGGKLRKAKDKRKNLRDAFRNAVHRAIRSIEQYDTPLAVHLRESIKCGNEAVYRTKTNLVWEVRPVVNE